MLRCTKFEALSYSQIRYWNAWYVVRMRCFIQTAFWCNCLLVLWSLERSLIFALQSKHPHHYISEALEGPCVTLVDSFMNQDCLRLCGTLEARSPLFRWPSATVLFSKSDGPSQDDWPLTLYASLKLHGFSIHLCSSKLHDWKHVKLSL